MATFWRAGFERCLTKRPPFCRFRKFWLCRYASLEIPLKEHTICLLRLLPYPNRFGDNGQYVDVSLVENGSTTRFTLLSRKPLGLGKILKRPNLKQALANPVNIIFKFLPITKWRPVKKGFCNCLLFITGGHFANCQNFDVWILEFKIMVKRQQNSYLVVLVNLGSFGENQH